MNIEKRIKLKVPSDKELEERFKKWAGDNSYLKYHNKKENRPIK